MKREELTEIGIAPELLDQIMALNGRDIEKHKAEAHRWEEKYKADTEGLHTQLDAANYARAADKAVQTLQFSSRSAKTAFEAELAKAALPLENGTLAGFDAFAQEYRANDPEAFAPAAHDTPVFVQPAGEGSLHTGPRAALRAAFGLND